MAVNIDGLRKLWQIVFGDTSSFLDAFFQIAFSPDRCRYLSEGNEVICSLYWFDCEYDGGKLAYIYAVGTHPDHRGKGLASQLLRDTHAHLKALGYAGAVLKPGTKDLFSFYERLGYVTSGYVRRFTVTESDSPAELEELSAAEYGLRRRQFLPENGILQEGATLDLLSTFADFYAAEDALFCVSKSEPLIYEYLGNPNSAPDIVAAFGIPNNEFQTYGDEIPYAMFYPLNCTKIPGYLGLSLD